MSIWCCPLSCRIFAAEAGDLGSGRNATTMVFWKRLDIGQGDGPMHPVGQINGCQGKWWVIPV